VPDIVRKKRSSNPEKDGGGGGQRGGRPHKARRTIETEGNEREAKSECDETKKPSTNEKQAGLGREKPKEPNNPRHLMTRKKTYSIRTENSKKGGRVKRSIRARDTKRIKAVRQPRGEGVLLGGPKEARTKS